MEILKKLEFDGACKRYAAVITFCIAVLGVCGALRGSTLFGVPVAVFGNIAACAALTLYESILIRAFGKALGKTAEEREVYVRRSGRIFAAVCIAAQAVKLFFLLLPCPEGEIIPRVVLIADALTWWIMPMKISEKSRGEFFARSRREELLSRADIFGVYSGSCDK